MKLLLDTNIILDALQERAPFDVAAKEILRRGQKGEIEIAFTANAVSDIFYLYTKARNQQSARYVVAFLLDAFGVVAVTHETCLSAMNLTIQDFEDALVVVCAENVMADYIITRDEKLLGCESGVPLMRPQDVLDKLSER